MQADWAGDRVRIIGARGFYRGWKSVEGYVQAIVTGNRYVVVLTGMYWEERECREHELEVVEKCP